jgi:hypothetical protein
VRFDRRIKVSIEHGHGNHLSDDWASTAYWYQLLPSPRASILPLEQRLPTRPADHPVPSPSSRTGVDADEVAEARELYARRFEEYQAKLARRTEQRVARSKAESQANVDQAADLRRRFQ